jgi:hypothetical protein
VGEFGQLGKSWETGAALKKPATNALPLERGQTSLSVVSSLSLNMAQLDYLVNICEHNNSNISDKVHWLLTSLGEIVRDPAQLVDSGVANPHRPCVKKFVMGGAVGVCGAAGEGCAVS